MEPEYVAKRIVEAVLRDEFLIYVPRPVWIFEFLNRYVFVVHMMVWFLIIYLLAALLYNNFTSHKNCNAIGPDDLK